MEERKSLELANAIWKYESQRKYLNQLTSEWREHQREFAKKQSRGISATQMTFYTNYLEELDSKIFSLKANLNALHEQVEKKRQDFLESRKQRKVVEELKSSDFERYLKEITRLEQIFIDEVASQQLKFGSGKSL